MRPRIIEYLISITGIEWIKYIIPTGTTVYVIAILAVWYIFIIRCRMTGLPEKITLRASAIAVFCGILGARLFYLIQHAGYVWLNPKVLLNLRGGTTSWGAYFFGFLGLVCYLKYHKVSILKYADVLGSCLAFGPFIGRWSCFFNGCCFGTITDVPWAVQFPKYSYAFNAHWKTGLIHLNKALSLPVHPVQIYSSLAGLILFIVLTKLWKNYSKKLGMTIAFYGLFYGLVRFFIEFFRGDVERYGILNLTISQMLCMILFFLSLFFLFIFQKRYRIPR